MRSYYGSVYEHQSTYCPNMPLGDLLYFASIIQKRIKAQKRDIYGGKILKIPIPHFVVFYNGKEEASETAADFRGGFTIFVTGLLFCSLRHAQILRHQCLDRGYWRQNREYRYSDTFSMDKWKESGCLLFLSENM